MIIREEILNKFKPVTLKQLDKVSLLDRIDTKYVFKASLLEEILLALKDDYYILDIDGRRNFSYSTMYYDTNDAEMYINHVRGKLNRYKIRHRLYVDSGLSYLEIKFKNNKNRTIKWRTKEAFTDQDKKKLNDSFLKNYVPYTSEDLEPSLQNYFNRITLVDKNFTQRVTFDFQLGFNGENNKEKDIHEIAIAELKIDKNNKNNLFQQIVKSHKIKSSGFSKYCIGKTLADENFCSKPSSLKPKLLELNKIANTIIYTT